MTEQNPTTARKYAERLVLSDPRRLSPIEQQHRTIAAMHLAPVPCPNCEKPLPRVDALPPPRAGEVIPDAGWTCTHCGAKLRYVMPLFFEGAGWTWELMPGQINAVPS